jgi:hypothetical protein
VTPYRAARVAIYHQSNDRAWGDRGTRAGRKAPRVSRRDRKRLRREARADIAEQLQAIRDEDFECPIVTIRVPPELDTAHAWLDGVRSVLRPIVYDSVQRPIHRPGGVAWVSISSSGELSLVRSRRANGA